jgi:hypothetical protein
VLLGKSLVMVLEATRERVTGGRGVAMGSCRPTSEERLLSSFVTARLYTDVRSKTLHSSLTSFTHVVEHSLEASLSKLFKDSPQRPGEDQTQSQRIINIPRRTYTCCQMQCLRLDILACCNSQCTLPRAREHCRDTHRLLYASLPDH